MLEKENVQISQKYKSVKPFLRWAGGKRWLIKELDNFLPCHKFLNYHEPFLGGGAIFFHLKPEGISFLNDLNSELIETYLCIKEDVEMVIEELEKYENTKDFYYKVRSKKYKSVTQRAARFIYLNQTSFNGIFRVNLKGEYNVPYGSRTKNFFEPQNLKKVSEILKNAELSNKDFSFCLDNVKGGDLVFLDPPYSITHNHNGFFKYNQKMFSKEDQYRLAEMIENIKNKNAFYILTNAAHQEVKNIFEKGDRMVELERASLIGGVNAKRGRYAELIVTNAKPSNKL